MALTDLGERLALIIDAKTDGAVTNMRRLTAAETDAAERADVLRAKIADLETRAAKRPLTNQAGLQLSKAKTELAGIESQLANVTPGASRAEQALKRFGLAGEVSGSAVVSGLKAGAVAAAAFGGFEFLKSGISNFTALADAVRQFQYASGASAQDASKLVAVSNALGVSSSSLALGVFRLGKQVGLAPEKFQQLGIAVAKDKQGNTDLVQTLENVATAYQNTQDPARRAAIVYEAFGRAGTTLLPILNANRHQLEEIIKAEQARGHILSQADITNAYNYQIATRELKDSMESLGISVAKVVVPALTQAEQQLTSFLDKAHQVGSVKLPFGLGSVGNVLGKAVKFSLFGLGGLAGSSSPSAEEQAAAEQKAQEIQAQQQQVEQAVLSTLAQPFDQLAGPQVRQQAKQTLDSALQAVKDAKREQAAALRELGKARTGSPVATTDQLTAAEARVTAAEAALRKARYIGGPGVASATASLASAQASLNSLRSRGGVDTNTLASAEDRLARANERVTSAQKKAKDAQKALNDASGLTAKEVLKRITGQDNSQRSLAQATIKLASLGVGSVALESLTQLNQQIPGTLVKVADTMTKGIAREINRRESDLANSAQVMSQAVADPSIWEAAGEKAITSFAKGLKKVDLKALLALGVHPKAVSPTRVHNPAGGYAGVLNPGVIINGGLHLKSDDPKDMGRKLSRIARQRALGSGQ